MNIKKDTKVNYGTLVELDQKSILEKMRAGEIPVPGKGTDERDRFEKFCGMDAGSDERKAYLSDEAPAGADPSGTPPVAPGGTPPPDAVDPDAKPAGEGDAAGTPAPASAGDTPVDATPPPASDEWAGYGSAEKLIEAHSGMKESVESLTKQVHKLRSTDGKLGQRVKDTETELKAKEKELAELREKFAGNPPAAGATPPPAPGTPPPAPVTRPVRPKAADFDDGEADSGFVEAMETYLTANDEYVAGLEGSVAHITGKVADIETRLADTSSKAEKAHSFADTQQQTAAESAQTASWDTMWSETRQVQQEMGFKTSVDIEVMNEHWKTSRSASASPEDKAASVKFLSTLPESDTVAFQKISPIINAMYSFDEGAPRKRYANTQAALWSTMGSDGKPLANQYSDVNVPGHAMSPQQAASAAAQGAATLNPDGTTATPLPAGDLGASDASITSQSTQDEKKMRLRDLQAMRKKNLRGFDASPDLITEYRRLVNELGGRTTLSHST